MLVQCGLSAGRSVCLITPVGGGYDLRMAYPVWRAVIGWLITLAVWWCAGIGCDVM